ncbi:MAG TPA: hypothetical protein VI461_00500 [Chitinophagaceae bacterium]|nr:hypothetical protein [Chitinophagaceae bacterium]
MQQLGLHQRKLFALAEALFAFIALLLPWTKYKAEGFNMFGGGAMSIPSENGFRSWGWLVVIGVVAVIICSVLGDKLRDYAGNFKYGVMGAFGLIILGAVIYLIRLNSVGPLQTQDGMPVKVGAGMGLWLALVAGVIGLAWVSGMLDKLNQKSMSQAPPPSTPPPPPPPPPTA